MSEMTGFPSDDVDGGVSGGVAVSPLNLFLSLLFLFFAFFEVENLFDDQRNKFFFFLLSLSLHLPVLLTFEDFI